MLDLLGNIATGGVIGLAGTGLSLIFKGFTAYQERKAKEAEQAHELNVIKAEAELAMQQSEAELAAINAKAQGEYAVAQEQVAGQTLEASYKHDKATYSNGFVAKLLNAKGWFSRMLGSFGAFMLIALDFLRGFMRVGITAASLWMLYRISEALDVFNASALPLAVQEALVGRVIGDISTLAIASALWWFGTRPTRTDNK